MKTPKFNIDDTVWIALRNGSSEKIVSFKITEITFKKKNNSIIFLYDGDRCNLKDLEEEELYSTEEEAAEFLGEKQEKYFSECVKYAKNNLKVDKMRYDRAARDYQKALDSVQKYEKLLEEVKKRKKDVAKIEKV